MRKILYLIKTDDEQRSYNMSRIRSINTKPEMILRKALWSEGFRYRKNDDSLPGKPDIAITKYRIAIFVDGEFWHGKDWDNKKLRIQKNRDYWIPKIERTIQRDQRDIKTNEQLRAMGWIVLQLWGSDILKDTIKCVVEIKDIIIQTQPQT